MSDTLCAHVAQESNKFDVLLLDVPCIKHFDTPFGQNQTSGCVRFLHTKKMDLNIDPSAKNEGNLFHTNISNACTNKLGWNVYMDLL